MTVYFIVFLAVPILHWFTYTKFMQLFITAHYESIVLHTFVANRSEQRLSCMDSANGDMFTNIRLCRKGEREREWTERKERDELFCSTLIVFTHVLLFPPREF